MIQFEAGADHDNDLQGSETSYGKDTEKAKIVKADLSALKRDKDTLPKNVSIIEFQIKDKGELVEEIRDTFSSLE